MKKVILAAATLASAALPAQIHGSDIDSIRISGKFLDLPLKKISENVEVITAQKIQDSPAQSIEELLQQVAGMDVRRRGANGVQADISLRGSSFEQVLILINGVRMNDAQTGHNSMNIPVDLANVARIEIVKGPAAQRYGNNAYAGVINIVTKTSTENAAKISVEGGDFGSYGLGLSATFGKGRFSNLFQAATDHSEGYRHNTNFDVHNYFYQTEYRLGNGKIGLQAGFSEKKFGANGFYASPSYTEQYEETQASVVAMRHEQNFGKFALNTGLYWRRGQDMYLLVRNKPEVYRNIHIGNSFGAEANGSYRWALGVTGLGVELRKEFLVSSNLGDRQRFISQVFFEHHFSFINDKLQLTPGVSWANFSTAGNFFYPGLNAGFDLTEHHKVYGNVSRVHRIPTFTDLYYKSKTELGNPDLVPESAVSAELGYRYHRENLEIKLSGFIRNTDNAIDWVKSRPADPWMARNIGELRLKGIEAEIKQSPLTWLNYGLSYTFIENRQPTDAQVRYALDSFRHQFIANLGLKFLKHFNNELVYRYSQRLNGYSYNLLDEKLSFRKNNFDVYLLINNLTAAKYTETFGVALPGRWFHLGMSYNIKLR